MAGLGGGVMFAEKCRMTATTATARRRRRNLVIADFAEYDLLTLIRSSIIDKAN